ncbi:MAG: 1-acyl-sn-glycerol-3-phosphate acyltransferase [Gammaproteobacteria bacterium]|nr:1-acyl-sn-glycerol-3-phosphate acyltransferase [Gammaproteobacteria bacterium]
MNLNFFQTFYILLKSVYATAKMSIDTIICASKKKLTQDWVDQRLQVWVQDLLNYIKVDLTVINPMNVKPIPGQATLLMCNHASLYDIPLTYAAFPGLRIRMIAKKELRKVPLMGRSMEAAGIPFVDRQNRHQAIEDLNKVRDMLADGIVIWIAPEGTRSADGHLARFKKGGFITAIQAQAQIIPMVIKGANQILPARSFHLSLNQKVQVIVGQPIDASQYSMEQRDELIQIVHATMQSMMDEERA